MKTHGLVARDERRDAIVRLGHGNVWVREERRTAVGRPVGLEADQDAEGDADGEGQQAEVDEPAETEEAHREICGKGTKPRGKGNKRV